MDPEAPSRPGEPAITIFVCEHCGGGAPVHPKAGSNGNVVPCGAGELDAARIRGAFLEGADGVLILGCVGGACCLLPNDVDAFFHIHGGALALHRLGVDPARLQRTWITPNEALRVPSMVAAFRRRIAALGPRFESHPFRPEPIPAAARG